jgi:Fibronectin type III domain
MGAACCWRSLPRCFNGFARAPKAAKQALHIGRFASNAANLFTCDALSLTQGWQTPSDRGLMRPDFHDHRFAPLACLMASLLVLAACGGSAGDSNATQGSDSSQPAGAVADAAADAMAQASRARRPGTAPTPTPAAPQPLPGPAPAVTNFAVLTWTPPVGTVTGYRVYYGTSSRSYQQALGSGVYFNSKEAVLTNLTANSTYYFAVTAIDAAGQESAYSAEDTKFIP